MLLTALMLAPLLQQQSVAVLRSGARIALPEGVQVAAGARQVPTGSGPWQCPLDPVVEVVDGSSDLDALAPLKALDYPAWVRRTSERGFLASLLEETPKDPAHRAVLYGEVERWGRSIDVLPEDMERDERVDELWKWLAKADGTRAALLCGRLQTEIGQSSSKPERRVGLVALRRALRDGDEDLRWAAARVALHQRDFDLQRPMLEQSLEADSALVRGAAAETLYGLDEQDALGYWALHLFRAARDRERIAAAGHLGDFGAAEPDVVKALVLALGAEGYTAPGSYIFIGRQVSVVTDFDVEVALAAAIADPRVSVLVEGSSLEVRVISTTLSRSIQGSLKRLTGADPGPRAKDWQDWYAAR